MELYKRNKGDIGIYPRGSGISPRVDNRECGEAVFIDGFIGTYGIPISLEGRGTPEEWTGGEEIIFRRTHRKVSLACKYHLFSVLYLTVCFLVAIFWQGWI